MIEFINEGEGKLVGIRVTGTLSDADYREVLIPRLEAIFAEHGKLDLLVHFDEGFKGWDLKAAWDDAAFGLKHRTDFGKLAVVGAPNWVDWCIKLSGFLWKGEIRVFPAEELAAAWRWLKGET